MTYNRGVQRLKYFVGESINIKEIYLHSEPNMDTYWHNHNIVEKQLYLIAKTRHINIWIAEITPTALSSGSRNSFCFPNLFRSVSITKWSLSGTRGGSFCNSFSTNSSTASLVFSYKIIIRKVIESKTYKLRRDGYLTWQYRYMIIPSNSHKGSGQ